jgi:hydrogenase expression/formation protein HypC
MCLGVPGRVIELMRDDTTGLAEGKVDFGGVIKRVNLSFVPEAELGDYVIVHVGFAISKMDEEDAQQTLEYLRELGEIEEPPPSITG